MRKNSNVETAAVPLEKQAPHTITLSPPPFPSHFFLLAFSCSNLFFSNSTFTSLIVRLSHSHHLSSFFTRHPFFHFPSFFVPFSSPLSYSTTKLLVSLYPLQPLLLDPHFCVEEMHHCLRLTHAFTRFTPSNDPRPTTPSLPQPFNHRLAFFIQLLKSISRFCDSKSFPSVNGRGVAKGLLFQEKLGDEEKRRASALMTIRIRGNVQMILWEM